MNKNKEILHGNFITILKFMHPNEPIKKWVEEDVDRIGHYHNQWDTLMPVVEKIESLWNNGFNVWIGPFDCIIRRQRESKHSELCNEVEIVRHTPAEYSIETKIEAVYNAVVKFVKWYNDNE